MDSNFCSKMKKIFAIFVLVVMGVITANAQYYGDGAVEHNFEIRLDLDYMTGLQSKIPHGHRVSFGNGITRAEEGGMATIGFGYNITGSWYVGVASVSFATSLASRTAISQYWQT